MTRLSLLGLLLPLACQPPASDTGSSATPRDTHIPTPGDSADSSAPDSGSEADTGTQPEDPYPLLPAVPLHTEDRWILDANGERFKLASVNWYGFESLDHTPAGLEIATLDSISAQIADMGFNSVRLPFSLEMVVEDPVIDHTVLAANPDLQGLTALQLLDAVIDSLARHGLVTILDNHSSEAVWYSLENGLWYTDEYPEEVWIETWVQLAEHYRDHPGVVGYELRNELRNGATWGGPPETDWKAAAARAADAILAVDSEGLIVVNGINYAADLSGVYTDPLELSVPGRLVWAAHDYSWFHSYIESYGQLAAELGSAWGFVIVQDQPYTAPMWVSEFGTCNVTVNCIQGSAVEGAWFSAFLQYLAAGDIDWAYFAVNGTMARGEGREFGATDWFGILDSTWSQPALPEMLEALQAIQQPWAFPE